MKKKMMMKKKKMMMMIEWFWETEGPSMTLVAKVMVIVTQHG